MLVEVAFIVIAILFLWQILKKPSNYPPGPWGLPLVGYPFPLVTLMSKGSGESLEEMRKKYGDVVSWRIGTKLMVFIFDHELAKEAFGGLDMIDRPNLKMLSLLLEEPKLGIIASSGSHWHNARRFGLHHLRNLGMGKSRIVSAIQKEASGFVEDLRQRTGKPTVIPPSLTTAILNVVWQLVAGRSYSLEDKEIWKFRELMKAMVSNGGRITFTDYFPWISYVVPGFILTKFTREYIYYEVSREISKFIDKYVVEHQKNLDPDDPKDFIDAYLVEMESQKEDANTSMSIADLKHFIADFFLAGTETTTTTLEWVMLYLARFPKVQAKLQEEIDRVLPNGTFAILEDRKNLPYTEAFIHEILRITSLAALGGVHTPSKDTVLGGYIIPKGAVVVASAVTTHYDPKNFESPQEFRPERFLDADGKFANPKQGFLPFGTGRRQCLGESLARMELLIFITTLVKNIHFEVPPQLEVDLSAIKDNPFMHLPKGQQLLLLKERHAHVD